MRISALRHGKEQAYIMKILIVEDDLSLLTGLSSAIKKQGYELDVAKTRIEAEGVFENGKYDLVILDVSLPDGSGFDICKKIRESSKVPIIFLTAADEETDIIMGLDMGGDDYITKPFKLAVLLSKIGAILRRSNDFSESGNMLCSNGITIDLFKGKAYKKNTELDLTAGEYKLLRLFMENKNIILSGDKNLTLVCDRDWLSEAIDNIVKNSLDHTKSGGVITIEQRKAASAVQIIIKDNGSGIHSEDLPHIFKRFYRSRFSQDKTGIGLGLPLAKAIVEAHGGNIEVQSELQKGTVFTITFLCESYEIVG